MKPTRRGRKPAENWILKVLDEMNPFGSAADDIGAYWYQKCAAETIRQDLDPSECLMEGLLGLFGEVGEVVDIIKKVLFQGHAIEDEREKLAEELGDVMWYLALIATATELPLGEIMRRNLRKLRERYPHGFSEERSRNRNN